MKAEDVANLENDLVVKLPLSFVGLILKYEFGHLSLGGMSFGCRGRYDRFLTEVNRDAEFPWWGQGPRPPNHLIIAASDGYAVYLNVTNGEILACFHEAHWSAGKRVAKDFELFAKGCGTLSVEVQIDEPREYAATLSSAVGGIRIQNSGMIVLMDTK